MQMLVTRCLPPIYLIKNIDFYHFLNTNGLIFITPPEALLRLIAKHWHGRGAKRIFHANQLAPRYGVFKLTMMQP
jgi:hypothetical protein